MKFNIIGFNNNPTIRHRQCVYHPGVSLIQSLEDPNKLFCPSCGSSYLPSDTSPDDVYKSRFGTQQTKIISPRKQNKYYDKQGNEINDPDLIADIQRGATVVSYQEFLPADTNSSETDTRGRTFPRKNK